MSQPQAQGFDYGQRVPGNFNQYERHKCLPPEARTSFVLPVRNVYIHVGRCKRATQCGMDIAETFAVDPKFYGRTFCCECRDYYPVSEFIWWDGGQNLDTSLHPEQYPVDEHGKLLFQAARDMSKSPYTKKPDPEAEKPGEPM